MKKCCIKDCDSHKNSRSNYVDYFQFPLHDDILLKKWLKQIELPNWKPNSYHHICSMHFREEDVNRHKNIKQPFLKLTSIPTIFPKQPIEVINPKSAIPSTKPQSYQPQPPPNILRKSPLVKSQNSQTELPRKIDSMNSPLSLQIGQSQLPSNILNKCTLAKSQNSEPQLPITVVGTNSPLSLQNSQPQLPPKIISLIGNAPIIQNSPVILIASQYPPKLSPQLAVQTVAQGFNQTSVNNSMQISTQYVKQIGAQYSQMPLHSSVQISTEYVKQIQAQTTQMPLQISTEYIKQIQAQSMQMPLQISTEYIQQIQAQSTQMPLQIPTGFTSQVRTQISQTNQINIPNPLPVGTKNDAQIAPLAQKQILVQSPKLYLSQGASQSSVEISEKYSKEAAISVNGDQDRVQKIADSPVQHFPISQPRLRRILPKPQTFDPKAIPFERISTRSQSKTATDSLPKPDILIIPKIDNSQPANIVVPSRYPGNKKPILRISIDREYDRKKLNCLTENKEEGDLRSNPGINDATEDKTDSSTREMTIENSSTNKAVTFKLDPRTGEIVFTTRQINDEMESKAESESTKVKQNIDTTHSCATNLRELYIKGQEECNELRRTLRVLRQRHKQEQEEIQKLQEHLTELGDKVQITCLADTLESRSVKRRETENSVEAEDREILTQDVKRPKRDIQGTRDLSKVTNGHSKEQVQPRVYSNNRASRLTNVECHSPVVVNLSEEEITDNENSHVEDASGNFNGDSGTKNVVHKSDFSNTKLIIT